MNEQTTKNPQMLYHANMIVTIDKKIYGKLTIF